MTITDNDFTWTNTMSASPNSLREEAREREYTDDPDNKIWLWVQKFATNEQLLDIGDYALSSEALWEVFSQHLYKAMRWGYKEYATEDLDETTSE